MTRSGLVLVFAALLGLCLPMAVAQEGGPIGCDPEVGGINCNGKIPPGGEPPGVTTTTEPGTHVLGPWEPYDSLVCGAEVGLFRFLVWASTGDPVQAFEVGLGSLDPFPPWGVFEADGLLYTRVCTSDAVAGVEDEIERRIPDAQIGRSPDGQGVTGLETWLWAEGAVEIPLFGFTLEDEATGVTYTVEAWAWAAEWAWDLGDGAAYVSTIAGDGADLPSSSAVRHTYETKSVYDLTLEVTWFAEWRVNGGSPRPLGPLFETELLTYDVVEVRSVLPSDEG